MAEWRINQRYRVVERLGRGADGLVLLVRDEQADDVLRALKVMAAVAPGRRARLAGEFRRLSTLSHPRLVRVHDLDVVSDGDHELAAGTLFFTADYIRGHTPLVALRRALASADDAPAGEPASSPLPSPSPSRGDAVGLLLDMAEDIASALAHVHAAGFVHRDVKPDNVIVEETAESGRRAMLVDLGLSTAQGVTGQARGTLAYMAPEALSGQVDPRSDLYALGATLYHAVAGHPPFQEREPRALVRAICKQSYRPLYADWLPAALGGLIDRLLARDLAVRHSAARVLLDDIERVREALGRPRARAAEPSVSGYRSDVGATAALLPPRLIGRTRVAGVIASAFDAMSEADGTRLLRVLGAPGSGRDAIITHAVRSRQLAIAAGLAPGVAFIRGSLARVASALGTTSSAAGQTDAGQGRADALE